VSAGFLSAEAYQGLTPETDFQAQVVERAELCGWRVFFIPDWVWRLIFAAMRRQRRRGRKWARPGFPDLCLVNPPYIVFAELKAKGGTVRVDQSGWLDDLLACGLEAYVWFPADQDAIEAVLGRPDRRRLHALR
jgi:hypothetical protein